MTTISSIDARFAQDQVGVASRTVTASISNLVSGTRQDANVADLSVGTILSTRVSTLRVTVGNAGQAKSLLETAKGALDTVLSLLQQQKNLAVKSADDSLTDNERGFLDQEFQAIVSEINRISDNANFNGKTLLDGSISGVSSLTSATSLATDNFGTINAGDIRLSGTVATGDLSTTAAKFGQNRIAFNADIASGSVGTATVTIAGVADTRFEGISSAVTFTTTTSRVTTAAAFVAAANSFTGGTDEQDNLVRNFKFVDNGDGSVSILAKESGTGLDGVTFGIAGGGVNDDVFMGLDGGTGNTNIDTGNGGAVSAFGADIPASPSDYANAVDGAFRAVRSANVGVTAARQILDITNGADTDVNGTTVDIAVTDGTATTTVNVTVADDDTDEAVAAKIVAALNNYTTYTSATDNANPLRQFTYAIDPSDATQIIITATKLGEDTNLEDFTFELVDNDTGVTGAFGATDITDTATAFDADTTDFTAGTNRAITVAEETIDTNLIGGFSNFSGTFNLGVAGANNTATFSVEINDVTYVSEEIQLLGSSATDTQNSILANTDILFYNPDGSKDTDGNITDNAFVLRTGSSAIALSDVSSSAAGQKSINTVADNFQTQLSSVTLVQERNVNVEQIEASSSDHRITGTVGTILEGLKGFDIVGDDSSAYNDGDVKLISDSFTSSGTQGSVGSFTVDRLTNTISTTVDGETYTAYLTSAALPSLGGAVEFGRDLNSGLNIGSYDSTNKILTLDDETGSGGTEGGDSTVQSTAKFLFYSNDTTDGKILSIDLGNVAANTAQIDISTTEGETALASALNAIFGVASNESLSFQVGASASDTIGVSIGSAKTTTIYKDDDGDSQTLSVATSEQAIAAGDVIDNAINNVVSLISDISAKITAFNSAIQNNQASIQNADAARSKLLDTDYTQESTRFAESRVRVDAATAVLTQVNSRIQNLLGLLQQ